MSVEQELKHQWCLHLATSEISVGKLACIFARLQKGSPLTDEEIKREEENVLIQVLDRYEKIDKQPFSESQTEPQ